MNLPVFITGPESTGKTTLAKLLASHYEGDWVPEYARTYISGLNRPYTYRDVEHVAEVQLRQIGEYAKKSPVFFDTGLIITKVWFNEVYGKLPAWFERQIPEMGRGTYLLCKPDLPWEMDAVRENPDKRDYLYGQYMKEISFYRFPIHCIQGTRAERLENAINCLEKRFQE